MPKEKKNMPANVTVSTSDFQNWDNKTEQQKQEIRDRLAALIEQYKEASGDDDLTGVIPDH